MYGYPRPNNVCLYSFVCLWDGNGVIKGKKMIEDVSKGKRESYFKMESKEKGPKGQGRIELTVRWKTRSVVISTEVEDIDEPRV